MVNVAPIRPYTVGHGVSIDPGDVVLMITVGFLEAQNAAGAEFGPDRLCEVVRTNVCPSRRKRSYSGCMMPCESLPTVSLRTTT